MKGLGLERKYQLEVLVDSACYLGEGGRDVWLSPSPTFPNQGEYIWRESRYLGKQGH